MLYIISLYILLYTFSFLYIFTCVLLGSKMITFTLYSLPLPRQLCIIPILSLFIHLISRILNKTRIISHKRKKKKYKYLYKLYF